jgi:hypothetical protein
MRAIALSMAQHACLRQGRRRLALRFLTAGQFIGFALVAVYGLNNGPVFPRQGRRRPTLSFFATGAGGVTTVQECFGGSAPAAELPANNSNWSKEHRREGQSRPAVHLLGTWPKQIFRDHTHPHPARFVFHGAKSSRGRSGSSKTISPVRDRRARATGVSCFQCQTATRSFLRISAPPRPFSPSCSPPPGFFSHNSHNTQHTRVKQSTLCFTQKDTQPSQTCSGGHITPNPTQNRCG